MRRRRSCCLTPSPPRDDVPDSACVAVSASRSLSLRRGGGARSAVDLSLIEARRVRTKRLKRSLKALSEEAAAAGLAGVANSPGGSCDSLAADEATADAPAGAAAAPLPLHSLHAATAHVLTLQELGVAAGGGSSPSSGNSTRQQAPPSPLCTLCLFLKFLKRVARELLAAVEDARREDDLPSVQTQAVSCTPELQLQTRAENLERACLFCHCAAAGTLRSARGGTGLCLEVVSERRPRPPSEGRGSV